MDIVQTRSYETFKEALKNQAKLEGGISSRDRDAAWAAGSATQFPGAGGAPTEGIARMKWVMEKSFFARGNNWGDKDASSWTAKKYHMVSDSDAMEYRGGQPIEIHGPIKGISLTADPSKDHGKIHTGRQLILEGIEDYIPKAGHPAYRALGGGVDTVPAMLTPGEFIMTKRLAKKLRL